MAARIARLALLYWAAIFALGFALGALRTLWLAPAIGAVAAVTAELPVMLGASWLVAARLLARRPLERAGSALAMGLLAFSLLLAAEAALAALLAGQGVNAWLAGLAQPAGALGLAGQIVFALVPLAVWRRSRPRG
ncbi:hypothetical protein [Altererythrobacter lauratis]|uniref:DUF4149 domain-containing protein n=1 Tax=Alteraurantiacibacter lauratis TaxID=2054627 RepID=A0ABV7EBJ2_9SPHN